MILMPNGKRLLAPLEALVDVLVEPWEQPHAPVPKRFWLAVAGLAVGAGVAASGLAAATVALLEEPVLAGPQMLPSGGERRVVPLVVLPRVSEAVAAAPKVSGECELRVARAASPDDFASQLSRCLAPLR